MNIIDNYNLIKIMRRTLNYLDKRLVDHGQRVAFIVLKMLQAEGNASEEEIRNISLITMLHDIGAYKTEEINKLLQFETTNVLDHSIYGYLFIKYCSPLNEYADAVLYHHTNCSFINIKNNRMHQIASYINLADRIDLFTQANTKMTAVKSYIEKYRNTKFSDESVALFYKAENMFNIINAINDNLYFDELIKNVCIKAFNSDEIDSFLKMISFSIDFRSKHTVTHTITTTCISEEAAQMFSLDNDELTKIKYGAMLHDLGKIAIPLDILENTGRLDYEQMKVMKTHVNITEEIISGCIDDEVVKIAVRHHEKLNGTGYHKGLKAEDLNQNERIVAVADILSALTGVRSYKEGYTKEKVTGILQNMSEQFLLDGDIVARVIENYDMLMHNIDERCHNVLSVYNNFNSEFDRIRNSSL